MSHTDHTMEFYKKLDKNETMIKRKQKFETPQFVFWLTEYGEGSLYPYDIIFSSNNVAPHLSREELKGLADFINAYLKVN